MPVSSKTPIFGSTGGSEVRAAVREPGTAQGCESAAGSAGWGERGGPRWLGAQRASH